MTPDSTFFVLAHNIRSLHNVGSIFRTSDVFGVTKLFLTGYTGSPPDAKLEKVSLGADKTVPWEYQKSPVRLVKMIRKQYSNLTVVGLENNLPDVYIPPSLSLRQLADETSPPEREKKSTTAPSGSGAPSGSSPKIGEVSLPVGEAGRGMIHTPTLVSLPSFKPTFPLLLVLGEEVDGIPKNVLQLCDSFVEIPQLGTKESLNVSVAFGVAAYAIQNQSKM